MQKARRTAFLLTLTFIASIPRDAQAANYSVISETSSSIAVPFNDLTLTNTVIQDGPAGINRFTMHRLRRPGMPVRGVLLLLPALGNNFSSYLFSEDGDEGKSFAAFFAQLGYEVWGYSPRETGIAPGACGAALDCSPALNWSVQTVLDDVTFVRGRIALATNRKPVIGGLSLGAVTALAAVNRDPDAFSGLLAWDGSLVTDNAAIRAHNFAFCNQFEGLVAAGVPVDDQSLPFVKTVAQLAQSAPNAPFAIPAPGFPPGLTNRQAFILILSTPNPAAPSPRPNFVTAAGDFTTGVLFYSSEARLAGNIARFNDVTANRVGRDLYCSLAGVETSYSGSLGQFKAPAMIIRAGKGFGSIMDELPAKLGSKSVTLQGIDAFAHVDHLGSPLHWILLEAPISVWLNSVFK